MTRLLWSYTYLMEKSLETNAATSAPTAVTATGKRHVGRTPRAHGKLRESAVGGQDRADGRVERQRKPQQDGYLAELSYLVTSSEFPAVSLVLSRPRSRST